MNKMLESRIIRSGISIMGRIRKRLGVMNWELGKRFVSEESAASQGVEPTQGYAPLPTGIAVDPAVHSSDPPQGQDVEDAIETNTANRVPRKTTDERDPLVSSPRLGHTEVGRPSEPNTQQRRQLSNHGSHPDNLKAQKKAQEEDNKEYYKYHKASPLSGLEFADTRKPRSQATDSPTTYYGKEQGIILWKPEQLDSAEDSLLRAVEIWKWNKMRGDPDSPHGRVLRELRGEHW